MTRQQMLLYEPLLYYCSHCASCMPVAAAIIPFCNVFSIMESVERRASIDAFSALQVVFYIGISHTVCEGARCRCLQSDTRCTWPRTSVFDCVDARAHRGYICFLPVMDCLSAAATERATPVLTVPVSRKLYTQSFVNGCAHIGLCVVCTTCKQMPAHLTNANYSHQSNLHPIPL